MTKDMGVYAIINPENKIYIGATTSFKRRFYQYKGLYEKSQIKLYESFLKYGVDNHEFKIIEYCSEDMLNERERYWGEYYNCLDTKCGLNSVLPGYGDKKAIMSDDVKEKIGKAHKGKTISEEQRKAQSEKLKGRKQTEEHINKRKMFGEKNPAYGKEGYFKGKKHTDDTKKLLSEQRKGKGLLGENSNAKKVIDTETGMIYGSAKEVSIKFNINYSTLKAWLQGVNKGKGRFKYVDL